MEPIITPEIVVAYSQCPRKAYNLLFTDKQGIPHEYMAILLACCILPWLASM
jgi:hypothetical protein